VLGVARAQVRDPLPHPQRLELGEREVLGEPPLERHAVDRLRRVPVGELRPLRDVGGRRDLVLVAHDEVPVARRDEVGLDVVRAHARAELVAGQCVLRPVTRGAAVGDDDRWHPGSMPGYPPGMCRNIRPLHNFEPPATEDEVRDAALQYVRKISGSSKPSQANTEAFNRAVEAIAAATATLLDDLTTNAPPKDREVEAAKRRERAAERYARA
jgi:hypothetical protein